MKLTPKTIGAVTGPVGFLAVRFFLHPEGLSDQANAVLASAVWIAIWWITEAIPISATALMPIILFPMTGGLELQKTTASFGHRFVFLYIGGFLVAIAIEKWNLHKRIALSIILLIGTNITSIILGFMLATAMLSMWISNTATTVMMLPIGMAIIAKLRDDPRAEESDTAVFGKALMLSIAYSASIGGMATLVGTPPNLVLASNVAEIYGVEISFMQWFMFGLPISMTLLAVCWFYLTRVAFRFAHKSFPGGRGEIRDQLHALGGISTEEKSVLVVFVCTAAAWISRSFLQGRPFVQESFPVLLNLDDTIIAMVAGLSLFLIPTSNWKSALLEWDDTTKLPWGIILLFGGGMALAEGFKSSGLAEYIGTQMTLLAGIALFLLILILVAAVNFLTEITSNLATTSMLLPILAPMALSIDVHPFLLMVSATVAASCAFMLPVATPPNAVVFGSGQLRIPDMVRCGIWMNLISIGMLSLFVYFLLGTIWGIDPKTFPPEWK